MPMIQLARKAFGTVFLNNMWEIYATGQFKTAVMSLLLGAVLCLFYDFQRLDRLVFRRGLWFTVLQDLFFWVTASFTVFSFLLLHTNGKPRGFVFAFAAVGFLLFRQIGSRFILATGRPLKKAVSGCRRRGKFVLKVFKKTVLRLQKNVLALQRRAKPQKRRKKAEKT